ncbi:hypothetical protein C8R47DRAFT_1068142 [Mycena vitilis]|nr:hypothetical protein C8R47DRAFT_1068142 [Mycena vitilis]
MDSDNLMQSACLKPTSNHDQKFRVRTTKFIKSCDFEVRERNAGADNPHRVQFGESGCSDDDATLPITPTTPTAEKIAHPHPERDEWDQRTGVAPGVGASADGMGSDAMAIGANAPMGFEVGDCGTWATDREHVSSTFGLALRLFKAEAPSFVYEPSPSSKLWPGIERPSVPTNQEDG